MHYITYWSKCDKRGSYISEGNISENMTWTLQSQNEVCDAHSGKSKNISVTERTEQTKYIITYKARPVIRWETKE